MRVDEIARLLGGKPHGDAAREIRRVAGLETAGAEDLAYAENARALAQAAKSRAGCILVPENAALPGKTIIAVKNPKLGFIRATESLYPPEQATPGIHPTAQIAPDARLAPGVEVGPYVVIESGASVGAGTKLAAGVFLGKGVEVGEHCVFHPRVTLYSGARIGNRVVLHSGVIVGSDGFGYVFAEGCYQKFPQLGQAIIQDDVEVGSNSTIDRGSMGTTVIGEGTKIDNLVQVAHNVRIGRHCVIAAQTGISGSVEVGDFVVMGGQVGIGDHVRIEDRAVLGGGAGVLPGKVIRVGTTVWGRPARPLEEFKKIYAHFSRLPELARKVKELSAHPKGRDS